MPLIPITEVRKFIKYASLKPSAYNKYELAALNAESHVFLTESEWEETKMRYKECDEYSNKLHKTVSLNNESIKNLKDGNLEEAIRLNKENIKIGFPATYSYERLMIYYRKAKDFDNEIRVINIAIKVFEKHPKQKEKYINRLKKAQSLKTNNHE